MRRPQPRHVGILTFGAAASALIFGPTLTQGEEVEISEPKEIDQMWNPSLLSRCNGQSIPDPSFNLMKELSVARKKFKKEHCQQEKSQIF